LMPPLMAPHPTWKQEARTETPPAETAPEPASEAKPEEEKS
jgi:hypothetical protein